MQSVLCHIYAHVMPFKHISFIQIYIHTHTVRCLKCVVHHRECSDDDDDGVCFVFIYIALNFKFKVGKISVAVV